jgi:hypothetical protein
MTRTPSLRVLVLVAATAALAAVVLVASWRTPLSHHFWFWFAACLVGEMLWVRLPVGRATASMASCFHFAAMLVLPAGQAVAIAATTGLAAELGFVRKPAVRALFNASQSALAVAAASACLVALGTPAAARDPLATLAGPISGHPLRLLAAAAAYFLINKGAVTTAIAVHDRLRWTQVWSANFGGAYELLANGALFSLGALLASHYAASGIGGTLLIGLPLIAVHEGYRRHAQRKGAREPQRGRVPRAA